MNRKLCLIIACCAALVGVAGVLASLSTAAAQAGPVTMAGIVVDTLEDELNSDGDCSLREAITAANDNTATDACPAGDGVITDTITFEVAGTITLTGQLEVIAGGALVIDGGEAITVSGSHIVNVLSVLPNAFLNITSINIVDGRFIGFVLGANIGNSGTLEVIESTVAGANGSGIHNTGRLALINSLLYDNNGFAGAGLYNSGIAEVRGSTFSRNDAYMDILCGQGGGIANWGTMTITNSTLSENTADGGECPGWGGGISNNGTLTINNSTLSGNLAGAGGGINSSGILTAINTIVANSPYGGDCAGAITDGGHNLDSDGSCGLDPAKGSLPNTDPVLGPLQDNGGPTWTHALLPESPAIDAGDNAQCPLTDQRGFYRPVDGNGDGIAVCDMGSFEYGSVAPWGIHLIPPDQQAEGAPGTVLTYSIDLINNTEITDTYTIELGARTWESSLSTDIIGSLSPFESQFFTLTVTIPLEADWYQTDSVVITATSQTSPTVYSAAAQVTTQAYAPPQIDISPTSLSSTQFMNEVVTRTLTISNGYGVTLTFDILKPITDTVLLLHLDEPAGSTVFHDTSGNNLDATCDGNSCPIAGVPGRYGTSVYFANDILAVPHNAWFDVIEDQDRLTVAAWAYITGWSDYWFSFLDKYEEDIDLGWIFDLHEFLGIRLHANYNQEAFCPYSFSLNEWVHVAVSYDRSENWVTFYVNGNQVCGFNVDLDIIDTSGEPMYIGYNPSGGDEYSQGRIDEIHIFDRALSAEEILPIYAGGVPGNLSWLTVDPISGSVPTDSSLPIQVTFDATDLQPDIYTTTLYVVNNDPLNPIVQVPVTMTVFIPVTPTAVTISGAESGFAGSPYNFSAAVNPISATLPVEYLWQASGQAPVSHSGGITDTLAYTWDSPGVQVITVTTTNFGGTVTDTHTITISDETISGLAASNDGPTLLGATTTFTTTVEAGTNISYTWDFGDDASGAGAAATHTYAAAGVYTATVTASNSAGDVQASTLVYVVIPETRVYMPIIIQGASPGIEGMYWRRQE